MKRFCMLVGILLLPLISGAAVTMDLVAVGNPGNESNQYDFVSGPGIGSVGYTYAIGTFEVQNSQYAEFLNSVAATGDTYGLYNTSMSADVRGGIFRTGSGTVGNPWVYSTKPNMADKPVNYVSFYDAARFVNWLENGQPTGAQGAGTTETGSYSLFTSGSSTTNMSARAADATWIIPTENEWYKAAYHQPFGDGGSIANYWLYPIQYDGPPILGFSDGVGNIVNDGWNVANYNLGADWNGQNGNVTTVGSAGASSASYYGTFDQGGNVNEWTETILGAFRVLRGGSWANSEAALRFTTQGFDSPTVEDAGLGFRIAAIPEPGAFVALGLAGFATLVWRRRRRSGGKSATLVALAAVFLFLPASSRAAVNIDLVTVGDPGNAPDPMNTNSVPGIGSVAYEYSIGKFEVQNNQYAEFLNSVATIGDTYGLYETSMGSDTLRGGISRTGSGTVGDPWVYSTKTNMGDKPVNYISFYDAVRFVNWLENGQPTGVQGVGTTETGSYTLFTNGSSTTNVSARGIGATWVIPTENEWYKAAYYQPSGSGGPSDNYWLYPTQSDSTPTVGLADPTGSITNDGPNVANYANGADWNSQNGNVTTIGSAGPSSDSYYGTFDQGGNVYEWNETIIGANRNLRGGAWGDPSASGLQSSTRFGSSPNDGYGSQGFRVAFMIPEPGAFVALGSAALAACARRRRRR